MGNSKAMWRAKYDVNFHSREAQEAVNAMGGWRAAMLKPSRKRKAVIEDEESGSEASSTS